MWGERKYIIERYIENREHIFYRVYMIGNRFAISEGREEALIKTIGRSERQRLVLFCEVAGLITGGQVPPDLRPLVEAVLRFVRVVQMEFGCLDIVRDDDGRFFIIDLNSTPHWGAEAELRIIEHLAGFASLGFLR